MITGCLWKLYKSVYAVLEAWFDRRECKTVIRDAILDILKAHRDELQAMHVRSLMLFGSVARNEATTTSDVDVLVQFGEPVGLFHFIRVRRRLAELLDRPVDLVTLDALRDDMRMAILKDAIRAA